MLYKLNYNADFDKFDKLFLFAISMLVGYLSWWHIELPTKKIQLTNNSKFLVTYSVLALSFVTLLSLIFVFYADSLANKKRSH